MMELIDHGNTGVNAHTFLLLNMAVCFYDVGTIWAHEIDIFRTWRLIPADHFHTVQAVHWRKLPYWVFVPVGVALTGSIGLVFYHPSGSPAWGVWGDLGCQAASLILTGMMWGPWQAKLSQDPAGPTSTYLDKILRTHWLRTLLINAAAVVVLLWAAQGA